MALKDAGVDYRHVQGVAVSYCYGDPTSGEWCVPVCILTVVGKTEGPVLKVASSFLWQQVFDGCKLLQVGEIPWPLSTPFLNTCRLVCCLFVFVCVLNYCSVFKVLTNSGVVALESHLTHIL